MKPDESVIVGEMLERDLPAVLRIAESSKISFWSRNDYESEIERNDSISLTAIKNREVVGFLVARLIEASGEAEIYNIAVEEKSRKKGIGALLLHCFAEKCRSRNIVDILLEVRSLNSGAIRFYQRLGFKTFGRRRGFYSTPPDDAWLLKLSLTTAE